MTDKTRKQHDLLGELDLPADALYGIQTARARRNFDVSGLRVRHELIKAVAMVKIACARANTACGMDHAIAAAIERACDEIVAGRHADAFVLDALQGGAGTSTNMNVNEVVATLASRMAGVTVDPFEHVNLHQSTNDVYPTALQVAAIMSLNRLEPAVAGLLDALQAKEREFSGVVKPGRTQLRDAVPLTLGREFGAYADAVARDRWRISKCVERLRVVNLGGTAIGTGINAPRQYIFSIVEKLRELTGLGLTRAENLVDATQNKDVYVEVSGIIRAHAVNLVKISNDLRLLSSGPVCGLGEIELPAVQPGSTIMPGKINPVIPEMVIQASYRVMAHDHEITLAAMHGELELNAFMPLIADALLSSLDLMARADRLLAELCVQGISANAAHCRALAESSREMATALVPIIGHEKAVRLAQMMDTEGLSLREAVAATGWLTPTALEEALSTESLCALGWKTVRQGT